MKNEHRKVPRRIEQTILNSLKGGVVPRTGLPYIAVGRKDEISALLHDVDGYVLPQHYRLSVVVGHAGLLAVYVQPAATEGLYAAVLIDFLVEELEGQCRGIEHGEGFEDGHVQQPVVHVGLRSYVGVVAVL